MNEDQTKPPKIENPENQSPEQELLDIISKSENGRESPDAVAFVINYCDECNASMVRQSEIDHKAGGKSGAIYEAENEIRKAMMWIHIKSIQEVVDSLEDYRYFFIRNLREENLIDELNAKLDAAIEKLEHIYYGGSLQ